MNCVSVGIFAWARLEPKEGVYEFDWLEQIIEELYQNGIYTMLATPSVAKPLWMSEKYEDVYKRQLNASVAAGILCYEVSRQRSGLKAVNP